MGNAPAVRSGRFCLAVSCASFALPELQLRRIRRVPIHLLRIEGLARLGEDESDSEQGSRPDRATSPDMESTKVAMATLRSHPQKTMGRLKV